MSPKTTPSALRASTRVEAWVEAPVRFILVGFIIALRQYACGRSTATLSFRFERRRRFLAVVGLLPLVARAAEVPPRRAYAADGFSIELPEGYIGPVEHAAGTSFSRGFRKPFPQSNLNTVIMISVQHMGPSFAQRLAAERAAMTRERLDPVIDNIAKNRIEFRKGEVRSVQISGLAALKAEWTGSAQGASFDGAVYCVLAGERAYAVQVQDPAGLGNARMAEATRAVERMKLDSRVPAPKK